jgi:hypothetical protein
MPSPFFQSYVAVLQRLGQIEAELGPKPARPAQTPYLAQIEPPAREGLVPEPAPLAEPLPGEEPLTLADLPLGRRFLGN